MNRISIRIKQVVSPAILIAGLFSIFSFFMLPVQASSSQILNNNNSQIPQMVTAAASTQGGTLSEGTYYYVVVALKNGVVVGPSQEVSCTITNTKTGTCTINWQQSNDPNITYRIYGRTKGDQDTYFTTAGNTFTDTGAQGISGKLVDILPTSGVESNKNLYIYIGISVIILLAILFFIFWRKRKSEEL